METCQITFSYINKKCLEWNLDDNSNANESKMPLLWLSTRVFFQRSSKKVEWKSSLIWKLSKKLRGPRWRPVCGKLNSKRDCHVPPVHVNHATHRGIISKKEEEDGEVPTYSSSSPPLLHMMAAAPATEFSVSLSKRLIKYSTHGLSVFLLGHGQPFCTLPGIQGSGEKKVNYELATPLTDTLKKKSRVLAWWLKSGFLYTCLWPFSSYDKCNKEK